MSLENLGFIQIVSEMTLKELVSNECRILI